MYQALIDYFINNLSALLLSPTSSLSSLSVLDLHSEPSILYLSNGLIDISASSPQFTSTILHELFVLLEKITDSSSLFPANSSSASSAPDRSPSAAATSPALSSDSGDPSSPTNNRLLIVLLRLIINIIQKNYCIPEASVHDSPQDTSSKDIYNFPTSFDQNFYLRNFFTKRFQGTLSPAVSHIFTKYNISKLQEEKIAGEGADFTKVNCKKYISILLRLITSNFSWFEYLSIKYHSKRLYYMPKDYEIQEIEYYSGVLLSFLSSCNPEFYFEYLSHNLLSEEKDAQLPLSEFLHQIQLLEFVSSGSNIIKKYFDLIYSIISKYEKIKTNESSIRQQLVIIYFSRGLKQRISSHPDRYIKYLDTVNDPDYANHFYSTFKSNIDKIIKFTYDFFTLKTVYDPNQQKLIKILDFHNRKELVASMSIFLCFNTTCFSDFVNNEHQSQDDPPHIFINSLLYYIRYCDARNMKLNAMYHEAACQSFILLFGLSTCLFNKTNNNGVNYGLCDFIQKHLKAIFSQIFIESLRDDSNCDNNSYNNNLKFMDEMRISYIVFENSLMNLPNSKDYVFTLRLIESMLKTYDLRIESDAVDQFLEDYGKFCKSPTSSIIDNFKPENIQFFKDIRIKAHIIFIFINAFRIIQDTAASQAGSQNALFNCFYLPLLDYHLETYVKIINTITDELNQTDKSSRKYRNKGKTNSDSSAMIAASVGNHKKSASYTVSTPSSKTSVGTPYLYQKPTKQSKLGSGYFSFIPNSDNSPSPALTTSQINNLSSPSSFASSHSSTPASLGANPQYLSAQNANLNQKYNRKSGVSFLQTDTRSAIQASDIEVSSPKDILKPSTSAQSPSASTITIAEPQGNINNTSGTNGTNNKQSRFYDDKISFAKSIFNLKSDKLKHKLKRTSSSMHSSSSSTIGGPNNGNGSNSGRSSSIISQVPEKLTNVNSSCSSDSSGADLNASSSASLLTASPYQMQSLAPVTLVHSKSDGSKSIKSTKSVKNGKIIKKSSNLSMAASSYNDERKTEEGNLSESSHKIYSSAATNNINDNGNNDDKNNYHDNNVPDEKYHELQNINEGNGSDAPPSTEDKNVHTDKSDIEQYSSLISKFNFIEIYNDQQYREKINDPFYICKRIMSNIFSCIKSKEHIYNVLSYKSNNKTGLSKQENLDMDHEKDPSTIHGIDTKRLLLNDGERVSYGMLRSLLDAITCGFKDMDPELYQSARLATKMLLSTSIPKGRVGELEDKFMEYSKNFDLSNYLMLELSESFSLDDVRLSGILKVFSEEFQAKLFFMKNNIDTILKDDVYFGFKDTEFLLNQLEKLEEFLLYISCSPNLQVITIAHKILRLIQEELSLFGYVDSNNITNHGEVFQRKNFRNIQKFISNWKYRDLFQEILSDDTPVVISSVISYRKKICKCLIKFIKDPNMSLFNSWSLIFKMWKELSKQIFKGYYHKIKTFEGCSVVLSAISGIIWNNSKDIILEEQQKLINSQILEFIQTNVKLLYSKNTHVQLLTQYVILEDIHPNSYKLVINELNKSIYSTESKSKFSDNTKFLLCDAILTFLKTIFKHSDDILIFQSAVEIVKFLKFVLKILKDDNSSMACRTKIRTCIILSGYFNMYSMAIQGFLKFRNLVLSVLLEWMESVLEDYLQKRVLNFDMILYLEASRVVKDFTKDLSLSHYSEDASHGFEKKEKEVIVDRYLKLIYSQVGKDIESEDPLIASQLNKSFENLVEGLGNLLNRNIDIALERSITLGFHSDYRIRLVFLKIFINTLNNMDDLSESSQDYWESQLCECLAENSDLAIAMANGNPSSQDIDLLATSLIHIFGLRNKDLDIVVQTVEAELKPKSSALRLNTVASRMLYFFSKSEEGDKHLEETVDKIMFELSSTHDYFDLNVEDENEKRLHVELFMKYLNKLVDFIVSSKDNLPDSFKFICYKIREAYSRSFNDDPNVERNSINVVSSFIFLRYFCPALMNPIYISERYSEDENMKVSLRFLAILLQGLATKSFSSSKNKWNLLLADHKADLNHLSEIISKYLKEISKPITVNRALPNREISKSSADIHKDASYVIKFLFNNVLDVRSEYVNSDDFSTISIEEKYSIWKKFDNIVNHLDPPLLIQQYKIPEFISKDSKYSKIYDFMTRFSTIDASDLLEIPVVKLFEIDSDHFTVVFNFYYYQKYHVDSILVVYIFIQFFVQHFNKDITLIVDLTGYLAVDRKHPLKLIQSVLTEDMISNISQVYLLNVSGIYFKEMDSGNVQYSSDYEVISTLKEQGMKNIKYSLICEHTLNIKNERKIKIDKVQVQLESCKKFVPAEFYIGTKHIHVGYTVKNGEASLGKDIYLTEIYTIKDSNLIIPENAKSEKKSDFILIDKHKKSRRFVCKDRLYIIKMFYVAKSITSSSFSGKESSTELSPNIEIHNDISKYKYALEELQRSSGGDIAKFAGYILNLTFSGILSSNTKIRKSSNELLTLLIQKSSFRLKNLKNFYIPDQTIPDDLLSYIVSISENLAEMYPEITYQMFVGFFRLFDTFPDDREKGIIFISPWIQNIYPYIYRSTGNLGIEHTQIIIDSICRVSRNFDYIDLFGEYFWKELTNNNFLIDMLCETVMYQVMQSYNLEENLWTKYIGLLTSFPTITLCSNIVQRMIKLASKIDSENNSDDEDNITIKEISILLKMCLYCLFNNRNYYVKFFPELLFIVLIYYNIGSLSMKKDLYELAYSLFYIFKYDDKGNISSQDTGSVKKLLKYIESDNVRFVYGVDSKSETYVQTYGNRSFLSNHVTRFISLFNNYISFVDTFHDVRLRNLWRTKLSEYVLSLTFNSKGKLSTRCIILFGVLSSYGITEKFLMQCIPHFNISLVKRLPNNICVLHESSIHSLFAITGCCVGLPLNFAILGWHIWSITIRCLTRDAVAYEMLLKCSISLIDLYLKSMDLVNKKYGTDDFFNRKSSKNGVLDVFFDTRKSFDEEFKQLEHFSGFEVSSANFMVFFSFVLLKGLRVPSLKDELIVSLKRLAIAAKLEKSKLGYQFQNCFIYLLVFLKQQTFWDFIVDIDTEDIFQLKNSVELDSNIFVPNFILEEIIKDDDKNIGFLIVLGDYFQSVTVENDERLRFLALIKYICYNNFSLMKKIYYIFLQTIGNNDIENDEKYGIRGKSLDEISIIVSIFKNIFNTGASVNDISAEYSLMYLRGVIKKLNIEGINGNEFIDMSDMLNDADYISKANEEFIEKQKLVGSIYKKAFIIMEES